MAEISRFTCSGCGAAIEFPPGQKKMDCPYCGVVNSIFDDKEIKEAKIELVVPVGVDQKDLLDFIRKTMIADDLAPDDVLDLGGVVKQAIAFYPCFFLKGSFSANWTASFGYDRQESYTDYEDRTINGRTTRVRVTRERTVTDWSPHSGVAKGEYLVAVYAGDEIPIEAAQLLSALDLKSLTDYRDPYVAGYDIRPLTMESKAAKTAADPLIERIVESTVYGFAQGDRQRDWSWTKTLKFEFIKPGLAPLAHGVFSYQGKEYNIWADGVRLGLKRTDALPRDAGKSRAIYLGYGPFFLGLGLAVLAAFLSTSKFWIGPIVIGLFLAFLFGFLRSKAIVRYSKKKKLASFARIKLEESGSEAELSEAQREELYQATKDPVKSFLAKTERDFLVIPLAILIFGGLVCLGVFGAAYKNVFYSSMRSATGEVISTFGHKPEPNAPDRRSDRNATAQEDSNQAASWAKDDYKDSSYSKSPASKPQKSLDYKNLANLFCSSYQPLYCLEGRGKPEVNGLVGEEDFYREKKYLKNLYEFRNGSPSGVALKLGPNGEVKQISNYQNGLLQGPSLISRQGLGFSRVGLATIVFYEQGRREGYGFTFDEEGRLALVIDRYVDDQPDGVACKLYPDGSVKSLQRYVNGQKTGSIENFSPGERDSGYAWMENSLNDIIEEVAKVATPLINQLPDKTP
ncbi:MAG: hypothetical protein LBI10_02100 [Deltaproteobacteria bacterium]|jgi:antitoxin component YwqK of YwqJK toxin-antitoxin module|nr:hypothetical protein [Deltaproteobacteria bacterium]